MKQKPIDTLPFFGPRFHSSSSPTGFIQSGPLTRKDIARIQQEVKEHGMPKRAAAENGLSWGQVRAVLAVKL